MDMEAVFAEAEKVTQGYLDLSLDFSVRVGR